MPLTTKSFFGTIRVSGDGIDGDPAEPGERVGIEASLSRCRRQVAEFTEDIEPRAWVHGERGVFFKRDAELRKVEDKVAVFHPEVDCTELDNRMYLFHSTLVSDYGPH